MSKPLTDKDLAFINFSIDEHLKMIQDSYSCPFESTIEKERERAEEIKQKFSNPGIKYPKQSPQMKSPINTDDYWFVEFSLKESLDFFSEGIGEGWYKNPVNVSRKTQCVLEKIQKYIGMTKEELVRGPVK